MEHPTAEQAALRALAANKTEIVVQYDAGIYNDRRYSPPWLANIVAWEPGGHPQLAFGFSSHAGPAELKTHVGAIVKYGQKDRRRNFSTNEFAIVTESGELERLTLNQARTLFRQIATNETNETRAQVS